MKTIFVFSFFLAALVGTVSAQPITGSFSSSFGDLQLIEKDGLIFGDYASVGVIVGKRTDDKIEATFVNRQSPNRMGTVTFIVSEKGRKLTGTWGWVGEKAESTWTADQTISGAPRLKNFGAGTGAQNFSGQWDTKYGKLDLLRHGSIHVGFYGEKGIIYGTVTGASYQGYFTNGAQFGEFSLSSIDGRNLKGRWRFEGKSWSEDGDWTGTKIDPARQTTPAESKKTAATEKGGSPASEPVNSNIAGTYRITFTRVFNGKAHNGVYGTMGVYLNGRILSGDVTIRPQDGKSNRVLDIPKAEITQHKKLPRPVRHTNYINLTPSEKPENRDFTHAYVVDRIREFKVLGEAVNEHAVLDFQFHLGTRTGAFDLHQWQRLKLPVHEIQLGKLYMVSTYGGWACFVIEKR